MKKTKYDLGPDERLDDLMFHGMKIFQNRKQFCFSLDAVLLAHFAHLKANAACVDLGTGTGVISLLLAARGAAKIEAVELNPVMADLASRSVAYNGLERVIAVHAGDYRRVGDFLPPGRFDLVVANPPYRQVSHGEVNELAGVAAARHEITANLGDVIAAAEYLLKFRGRLAIVHLPERLSEIIVRMSAAGIEPKRLRLAYPRIGKRPNMVLVEGAFGAKPGLFVEKPLIVHREDGAYTEDILQYYREPAADVELPDKKT